MSEINPVKLQKPLKDKEGSFYPLTTYDQIIMPDNSRWNGEISGNNGGDATTLNGMTFEELKKAILSEAVYQ